MYHAPAVMSEIFIQRDFVLGYTEDMATFTTLVKKAMADPGVVRLVRSNPPLT